MCACVVCACGVCRSRRCRCVRAALWLCVCVCGEQRRQGRRPPKTSQTDRTAAHSRDKKKNGTQHEQQTSTAPRYGRNPRRPQTVRVEILFVRVCVRVCGPTDLRPPSPSSSEARQAPPRVLATALTSFVCVYECVCRPPRVIASNCCGDQSVSKVNRVGQRRRRRMFRQQSDWFVRVCVCVRGSMRILFIGLPEDLANPAPR